MVKFNDEKLPSDDIGNGGMSIETRALMLGKCEWLKEKDDGAVVKS